MAMVQQPMCGLMAMRCLPCLCMYRNPLRRLSPLISLKSFCPRPMGTVTVRAQRAGTVERASDTIAAPTFESLGLGEELLSAMAEHRLSNPTEIQAAAIPEIMRGGDLLLASHTGSGKTLAYLLPLIKLLRDQEAVEGAAARPKRPRALVLGPTRELTDQILSVAKSISHHARFRSACVNGGGSMGQQTAALASPLDILIGTPQKVAQHAERGHLYYGDVQLVVLDEADTMFDKGFGPEVRAVLRPLRLKEHPARCVLVLATLGKDVQKLLLEEFPRMRHIKTSSLHRGVAGARHSFLPVPALANKLDLLSQVITGEQKRGKRIMVFCNTLDSCRATDHFLRDRGIPTACYHGDVPLDGRREAIQNFAPAQASERLEDQPVLVCTDLAARGLDMPGRVDHVVNFDFPMNPIDYIHRTGRTARAGAAGRITSLVAKRDRTLAGRIEDALAANRPLDELSAQKAVLPPNMRPKEETLKRREVARKAEAHARKGTRGAAREDRTFNSAKTPVYGGGRLKDVKKALGSRIGIASRGGSTAGSSKGSSKTGVGSRETTGGRSRRPVSRFKKFK